MFKLGKVYLQICQPLVLLGSSEQPLPSHAASSLITESVFVEAGPRS